MLIDAIVKLHDQIQNMKLGVNRENQVTELEEARLRRLPLVAGLGQPAGSGQPGSSGQADLPFPGHQPGAPR
jgi:hypothetical protein